MKRLLFKIGAVLFDIGLFYATFYIVEKIDFYYWWSVPTSIVAIVVCFSTGLGITLLAFED